MTIRKNTASVYLLHRSALFVKTGIDWNEASQKSPETYYVESYLSFAASSEGSLSYLTEGSPGVVDIVILY